MNAIEDIAQRLRSQRGKVRLRGTGSRSHQLPTCASAEVLDLSPLNRIQRLDPGDQTCTVECGVTRRELDAALLEHDLELPCLSDHLDGTIGGLFASDPFGPAAAGCPGPRNLLLGMDALLANGTSFRSGARVVKSVAGFDVHKLLVGSLGRLFVATRLHLRLKPRPRAEQWFSNQTDDLQRALRLLQALRTERLPPTVLQLRRERDGALHVSGRLTGRSVHVQALQQRHGLQGCAPPTSWQVHTDPALTEEVIRGMALPSALDNLLKILPKDAPFTWLGGGRFEVALRDEPATDAVLEDLPKAKACGAILIGTPSRRNQTNTKSWSTPMDSGEQRIAAGLKRALDPDDILV
jgi:hypothetical protein